MTFDRTNIFLLAVIAIGVLLIALRSWTHTDRLPGSVIMDHLSALERIEATLVSLENGTCSNPKIC